MRVVTRRGGMVVGGGALAVLRVRIFESLASFRRRGVLMGLSWSWRT